jgi:transcription termination factor NusB
MQHDTMDSKLKIALYIFSWIFTISGFLITRILSEVDVRIRNLEDEAKEALRNRSIYTPQIEKNNGRIEELEQWRLLQTENFASFAAAVSKNSEHLESQLNNLQKEWKLSK